MRRRAIRALSPAVLATCLASAGCTNALFFYETQKISMTIEGKPDSSQPVQGSFGAKARTVIVVPPRADGEAGSMISSFIVRKDEGFFGPLGMKSALITGEPSTNLGGRAAVVAQALIEGGEIPSSKILAQKMINNAVAGGAGDELRRLVDRPCKDVLAEPATLTRLGEITGLGSGYAPESESCRYHDAIREILEGQSEGSP